MGPVVRGLQEAARDCGLGPRPSRFWQSCSAASGPRDRVVVGVDAPDQLRAAEQALEAPSSSVRAFEAAAAAARSTAQQFDSMLDPRTWPALA
jgi:hypothetical protein